MHKNKLNEELCGPDTISGQRVSMYYIYLSKYFKKTFQKFKDSRKSLIEPNLPAILLLNTVRTYIHISLLPA